ncbi:MAG: hypothetical protein JSU00_30300 [Acidobacteria bacterium]|nr:hypothetical protein [Acidobacteriota bacterium]
MRIGILIIGIFAVLALAPVLGAQPSRISGVDPDSGKVGDVIGATGEQIDASKVDELYLTDGKTDIKTEIVSQNETVIKFKIPSKAKAGRYSLMIKTKGADAKLLEQPVRITIEE